MPLVNQRQHAVGAANPPFVPEADITETLLDGRTIQIAARGVPVPYAEAVRLGLVKVEAPTGPTETKPRPARPPRPSPPPPAEVAGPVAPETKAGE